MLAKPLSFYVMAAGALIIFMSTAGAEEFGRTPIQEEERCRFVTDLVKEFQEPLDEKVEPVSVTSLWRKIFARDVAKTDELAAYLTELGIGVYSDEQLLSLDLKKDRVSVFILRGGRIQVSCG